MLKVDLKNGINLEKESHRLLRYTPAPFSSGEAGCGNICRKLVKFLWILSSSEIERYQKDDMAGCSVTSLVLEYYLKLIPTYSTLGPIPTNSPLQYTIIMTKANPGLCTAIYVFPWYSFTILKFQTSKFSISNIKISGMMLQLHQHFKGVEQISRFQK